MNIINFGAWLVLFVLCILTHQFRRRTRYPPTFSYLFLSSYFFLQIAENVARIETNQLIPCSYHPHTAQVSSFIIHSHFYLCFKILTLQVASPSLVLFRKYGSAIDHAILLCGLFLGIGLNAYVCIGTCKIPYIF